MTDKIIYIVTSGQYSDYRIEGIYSTKRKAEYAKKIFSADYIEEYELNKIPEHPKGMFLYAVIMDKNGNTEKVYIEKVYIENCSESSNVNFYPYECSGGDDEKIITIHFSVWARNEKHAIKIVNEKRIGLVVNNLWPKNWDEYGELINKGFGGDFKS